MRTGLIAKKIGMTRFFTQSGVCVPVTALKVDSCCVIDSGVNEKGGYAFVTLGTDQVSSHRLTKPLRGFFEKKSLDCFRSIKTFRVSKEALMERGSLVAASHFQEDQYVDVTGVSIGKGFAGGMKRHNFGGLRASHGVSVSHRSHGSTGNRQDPGKVFKNKKMAGHMGSERVTTLNLKVFRVDDEKGVVFVHGAVPGAKGGVVYLRDAIKKKIKAS